MSLRTLGIALALACIALPAAAQTARDAPANATEALHVLNRLGYGPRPGDVERVSRIGIDRYIEEQLRPEKIALPESLAQRIEAFSQERLSQADLITTYRRVALAATKDGSGGAPGGAIAERNALYRKLAVDFAEQRLHRAIESPRQLEEAMVEFWFNHFNVAMGKGLVRVLVEDYEREAIRPHALGRFRDLLGATAKHPAMLFYLDNWLSSAPTQGPRRNVNGAPFEISGLNENYARELMELHTLGVDGGYTQNDVTELARMLTGWTFQPRFAGRGPTFVFEEGRHDAGTKTWLGRTVENAGVAEGERALDVLASHPSTARHLAFKLAQFFVADNPPPALVDRVARQFAASGGDIRSVLGVLFASPEFRDPATIGAKFKTPYHYVVSTVRAADVRVNNVQPLLATMRRLGMPLYGCPTPDGYKNTAEAWFNAGALAQRIDFATAVGMGRNALGRIVDERLANDPYAVNAGRAMQVSGNAMQPAPEPARPVDFTALLATVGAGISADNRERIAAAQPEGLRSALVLGSPDFMRR